MKKVGFFVNVFSFTPQKQEIHIRKVSIDQKTGEQIIVAKVNDKETLLKPFNIENKHPRKVVCISGEAGCVRGRIYNVVSVNVDSWKTNLSLKETGYTHHNSVNFAELPD